MAHKKVAKVGLAELAKRVPPNQALQFQEFQAKHAGYQARVNKQPDKLPTIDWDFYRINVRPESKKLVDEFQQKYKTLCESFDAREKQDYSKYYVELDKVRKEMQDEVDKFKAESNARIKALEAEYESVKALKPYEEMTAEEYCDLLPDKKMYTYEGHPSFWPHNPEEQSLEPAMKGHGHDDHGGSHGGDHGKPPKKGGKGGGDTAGGAAPKAAAENKGKDAKPESKGSDEPAKKAEHAGFKELSLSPSKTAIDSNEAAKKQTELSNKLIEEDIKNALVYDILEDAQKKSLQAIAMRK